MHWKIIKFQPCKSYRGSCLKLSSTRKSRSTRSCLMHTLRRPLIKFSKLNALLIEGSLLCQPLILQNQSSRHRRNYLSLRSQRHLTAMKLLASSISTKRSRTAKCQRKEFAPSRPVKWKTVFFQGTLKTQGTSIQSSYDARDKSPRTWSLYRHVRRI